MPNVRKRLERLERFLALEPASDPYDAIQRLALQSLSTEDLMVLSDVIEQGGASGFLVGSATGAGLAGGPITRRRQPRVAGVAQAESGDPS